MSFLPNHVEILINNINANMLVQKNMLGSEELFSEFDKSVNLIVKTIKDGGRIYIAGNGGSAADAQHLAAEFVGRFKEDRQALAAESLTADTSLITAIANDYDYSWIFIRQLEAKMTGKDVFIAITTSGNSPNILKALEFTKMYQYKSILFTGKGGGKAKHLSDINLIVPSGITSEVQQSHMLLYHSLIEAVEKGLNV